MGKSNKSIFFRSAFGWLIITLSFSCFHGFSQEIQVKGGFQSDSIKIGEVVPYVLTTRYPRELNIIYPDSLFDFSPFEFESKNIFNTRSDSLTSFDSVIYYLTTFEIDPVQTLIIPVYQLKENDSITLEPALDSLLLVEMIPQMPDSIALKENLTYSTVNTEFNYPYLIFGLGLFLLIVIGIALFFGKQIRQKIAIYRLQKRHDKFLARFHKLLMNTKYSKQEIENILLEWKRYMERLENTPFTKLTTKEIIGLEPDNVLKTDLKIIDRMIYSNEHSRDLSNSFKGLENYADNRLSLKMNFLKNAK